MIRLSLEKLDDAEKTVAALATAREVVRAAPGIILGDIDDTITDHIRRQFEGRSWAPLRPGTMMLRQAARGGQSAIAVAKNRLIRKRSGTTKRSRATKRLYYSKKDPKVPDWASDRAFGWTKTSLEAATAPGKLKGKKNPELVRNFKSKGKAAYQRLLYWHYGTKQRVTKKQAIFLSSAGFPVNEDATLRRKARPIYDDREVERISTRVWEQRVDDFLEAVRAGAPEVFSQTVVRR